ncbi:MAG TPA: glycosyltransferase, partial [Thermoanaerobaculia bacterium]|nr:glycosyltransferase [Thermoanaerobaculia bacterium]
MKGSTKTTTALPRVAVVVMGDLGRSRRMLAHARCLAEAGWAVDLIGFRQTDLPSFIDSRIRVRSLPSFDSVRARRPAAMFFIFAIARQFLLSLALARILLSRFDVVLVQIPPSFPALPLILLAAKLRKSLLVIDWHNTTAAMLRLRVSDGGGLSARIVRFCGDLEIRVARGADAHFCATAALTGFIGERGLSGQELPDAIDFQARDAASPEPFTIVSPSSWSSDDDFELFFNALPLLDSLLAPTNLRLRFLFSGVGELREWFESRCATLSLN